MIAWLAALAARVLPLLKKAWPLVRPYLPELLAAFGGFLLGVWLSSARYQSALADLRDYSHRVTVTALATNDSTRAYAESQRHRADSLQDARRQVIRMVERDTAAAYEAAQAVARAKTLADENVALRLENVAQHRAIANLWVALGKDSLSLIDERHASDSLKTANAKLAHDIEGLNARIQALTPHQPPKLVRVGAFVVKYVALPVAAYECGRHKCL